MDGAGLDRLHSNDAETNQAIDDAMNEGAVVRVDGDTLVYAGQSDGWRISDLDVKTISKKIKGENK